MAFTSYILSRALPLESSDEEEEGEPATTEAETQTTPRTVFPKSVWRSLRRYLKALKNPKVRILLGFVSWFCFSLWLYFSRNWCGKKRPLRFAEALYLMAQMLTTVGYGDLTPVDFNGRMLTCAMALYGVMVLSGLVHILSGRFLKKFADREARMIDAFTSKQSSGSKEASLTCGCRMGTALQQLVVSSILWLVMLLCGALFYTHFPGEERPFDEALYMGVVTLTTIGFGDQVAHTDGGMIFGVFWMIVGVAAFANMVGSFSAWYSTMEVKQMDKKTFRHMFGNNIIQHCVREVHGNEQKVSRGEYILFMLQELEICDAGIINELSQSFDCLDTNKDGSLTVEDCERIAAGRPLGSTQNRRRDSLSRTLSAGGLRYKPLHQFQEAQPPAILSPRGRS